MYIRRWYQEQIATTHACLRKAPTDNWRLVRMDSKSRQIGAHTTENLLLLGSVLASTLQHSTLQENQLDAVRELLLVNVGKRNLPYFIGNVVFPGLRRVLLTHVSALRVCKWHADPYLIVSQ